MKLSLVLVLLVTMLTAGAQIEQTTRSRIELEEPGVVYRDRLTVKTGEQWLGLSVTEAGSQLNTYRLTVKQLDPEFEGNGGMEISTDSPLQPIFLLKGASMLFPGPVVTAFDGSNVESSKPLEGGSPVELYLGGSVYSLEVSGSGDDSECSSGGLPHNARLVLKSGDRAQTVYSLGWHCGDESLWRLIWAGDLDGDGKLDLYLDFGEMYFYEKRLLLSSQAAKGQLVKDVARLQGSCGC